MKAHAAVLALLIVAAAPLLGQSRPGEGDSRPKPAKEPPVPGAFVTSQHVVYTAGQPIDITFAINSGEGEVVPGFSITDSMGAVAPARQNNAKYLWEAAGRSIDGQERDGVIPPDRQHIETITDLREWYEFASPGMYDVAFDGGWIDANGKLHQVASNKILIKIAGESGDNRDSQQLQEIPLADIWALEMPGTKPMKTAIAAAPDRDMEIAPEGKMVREIIQSLNNHESFNHVEMPGFAVRGIGLEALREAHAVLVDGQEPSSTFVEGEQISLIFYSKHYGSYIHIEDIELFGTIVEIRYKVVSHFTANSTSHLAIIPMLPARTGEYRVEMKPMVDWTADSAPSLEHLRQRVCRSFAFNIVP